MAACTRYWLSVALSLALYLACPASACASLTIDLRAISTTSGTVVDEKHVLFTGGLGATVRMELWGHITGNNSDAYDEALISLQGSFLSSFGGLLGNMSVVNSPFFSGVASYVGDRVDLDGDGDIDVGSNNAAAFLDFFTATSSGPNPMFGPDAFVATVTWTNTFPGSDTAVDFRRRDHINGVSWAEDGVVDTGRPYTIGDPVLITVPEPASTVVIWPQLLFRLRRGRRQRSATEVTFGRRIQCRHITRASLSLRQSSSS